MIYFSNSFSLSMLSGISEATLSVKKISSSQVREILSGNEFISAIGHNDTAVILSDLLGLDIEFNRVSLKLTTDDFLIVAQYDGPRLPEGSKTLPIGAKFLFYIISYDEV